MVKAGQVVMKIAGRDAGKIGIVVEVLDNNYVLIDGAVRRKKCNTKHLEFLGQEVNISKNASSEEAVKALNSLGFSFKKEKKKKKEKKEKPSKIRKSKKKEEYKEEKKTKKK